MSSATIQRALLLLLVALLAAIGAILLAGRRTQSGAVAPSSAQAFNGAAMPPGLHAADFSLSDQHGYRVVLSQDRGKVVILTFIHSLCHDACPLMVEQIKGALNELGAGGRAVSAIGVSVAPSEDTAANRRRFLDQHQMDARLEFVNGSAAQLRRVWHAYAIQPGTGPNAHSAFVLLIDKRGIERVGFAADQLTPEGLAHDVRALQRERA